MIRGAKKIILILVFTLIYAGASGQQYYFKHYQADDGLTQNTVTSIIQDRTGFMWIGTKGGLNRFDAYTFKRLDTRQGPGINYVTALCEDNKGMIWIATTAGVFKYNPYSDAFEDLKIPARINVEALKIDSRNNIWMLYAGKLHKYDQHQNKLIHFGINGVAFGIDNADQIWIGTSNGGLIKFRPSINALSEINIQTQNNNSLIISAIFPDKNYILIGSTKRGLLKYDLKTGKLASVFSKNPDGTEIYVRDIQKIGTDDYWAATESGIYRCNPVSLSFSRISKKAGDPYSLNDNAVYTLCTDNQNGVWAGTYFGGLNYVSDENNRFEKYYPINSANSISGNAVREICQDDDNNIWIGTEDAGINRMNPKTGEFSHITSEGHPHDISYPNIHGMQVIGDRLFMGPYIRGLEVIDLRIGAVAERYPVVHAQGSRESNFVMSIFRTSDHEILIGTMGAGLFYYGRGNAAFTPVGYIPGNSLVYSIAEDHTGTIWTGSLRNGTFYYNPKTGIFGNIHFFKKNKERQGTDYIIQGIYEDSDRALWFATEGGGLVKLDKDRKTFKKFTTANGLPTNNIYRMLEDSSKNLWISSLKGLICFNLKTEKFHVYTQSNGLLTDQFNYNSAFKDKSGKMYFGTVKGMIAFRPEEFKKRKITPQTYITGFQINNIEVSPQDQNTPLKKSILYTDSIKLKYNQSSFNIEFAALNFSSAQAVKYKYRMEELDKDWIYLKTNRTTYFTELSPGTYHFVVQATSNIGDWTGTEKTFVVVISPPYWKTWSAYAVYFLLFSLLLYGVVIYYHRQAERKNLRKLRLFELEKEKEVYQAKIEFFTNIAHEIQTPLTLIQGPLEWAIKKIDDITVVKKNLKIVKKNTNRLVALTGQLLDFRKTEMNEFGLNFVTADINFMLSDLLINFKAEIEKKNIQLDIQLPKEHIKASVDKEAFIKILNNLISNAIKYCEKIIVIKLYEIEEDNEYLKIQIMNDGKLIIREYYQKIFEPFFRINSNKEVQGTGIGLSLAKSLAELHQGTLNIIPGNPGLNTFELVLPVHQKFEFKLGSWKNLK